MHFKFNQAWTSAGFLQTGLRPHWEARILRERGGLPLLKCVLKYHIHAKQIVAVSTAKMPQQAIYLIWKLSFSFSSSSDIRNSKSRESTGIKCSTGLLMHDLIIDIDIMIMQILEKKNFFWFFVLPFFQKKHKIKIKAGSKRPFY